MEVRKASHLAHVQHLVHKGALPEADAFRRCYSNKTMVAFIYSDHEMRENMH